MKNKILLFGLIAVLITSGLWYLFSKKSAPTKTLETVIEPTTQPTSVQPTIQTTIAPTIAEKMTNETVKEISIEGGEFFFKPAVLTLKKGEKVRLVFNNIGKMPHDFVVDELNVRTATTKSGANVVAEFTPIKTGTFEFYCSIGQHRANGMKGMMTVQ